MFFFRTLFRRRIFHSPFLPGYLYAIPEQIHRFIEPSVNFQPDAQAIAVAAGFPDPEELGELGKGTDENSEKIQALVKALQTDAVRTYINSTYAGAVQPIF